MATFLNPAMVFAGSGFTTGEVPAELLLPGAEIGSMPSLIHERDRPARTH